jgi:hypothetical protein
MKIAICPMCERQTVLPVNHTGDWYCLHSNITVYNPDPMFSEKLVPFEKIKCKALDRV